MGATLEEQGMNRRTFYLTAIYGLWALIGAALAIPAGIYLLFPPRLRKGPEWVKAGDLTQLQSRSPEELVFRLNRTDGWKITSEKATAWVVKLSDKEIVAYGPQCPHLGCAYHWDQKNNEFLCPCHASTFSIDGKVLSGPAPRPLDRYEVKIEGNSLLLGPVHKSEGISG
jgi:menaquinol-cytochrome c reductase iron-sulfur subunit